MKDNLYRLNITFHCVWQKFNTLVSIPLKVNLAHNCLTEIRCFTHILNFVSHMYLVHFFAVQAK